MRWRDIGEQVCPVARALSVVGDRCTLIQEDADALPFPEQTYDAVACLETLEFTPNPERTVGELLRVLRPGGVLLLTNRIGRARWYAGRAYTDEALVDLIKDHGKWMDPPADA